MFRKSGHVSLTAKDPDHGVISFEEDIALEIRAARPNDAQAIAELHAASWRDAYVSVIDPAFLGGPVEVERLSVWTDRLTAPASNQQVVVACQGAELIGFACGYAGHHERWGSQIENLHVRSSERSQGVGRILLRTAAECLREASPGHGLHLWVFETNT